MRLVNCPGISARALASPTTPRHPTITTTTTNTTNTTTTTAAVIVAMHIPNLSLNRQFDMKLMQAPVERECKLCKPEGHHLLPALCMLRRY
ncbi:hypothetical protein M0802_010021 [Mischocyttarus mexicanus]|nr:hypothetical protein M0802_010021 [Mischocyttarus mexicanus]